MIKGPVRPWALPLQVGNLPPLYGLGSPGEQIVAPGRRHGRERKDPALPLSDRHRIPVAARTLIQSCRRREGQQFRLGRGKPRARPSRVPTIARRAVGRASRAHCHALVHARPEGRPGRNRKEPGIVVIAGRSRGVSHALDSVRCVRRRLSAGAASPRRRSSSQKPPQGTEDRTPRTNRRATDLRCAALRAGADLLRRRGRLHASRRQRRISQGPRCAAQRHLCAQWRYATSGRHVAMGCWRHASRRQRASVCRGIIAWRQLRPRTGRHPVRRSHPTPWTVDASTPHQ